MKYNTRTAKLTILAVAAMMLAGCAAQASASPQKTIDLSGGTAASEVRLGYFANVTHAPALAGLQEGILQKDLGSTKLQTQVFNAGPATIEALSAGAIDAAYIGPNPAINSFIQSHGQSLRIVAGATTGGAQLVVAKDITDPKQLKGKTLATPQLGNTQDVALRTWLKGQGYQTSTSGGGDVNITPTDNAQTLTLFQQGKVDGAWLPEPWASRLVAEGGHVLVDEASLWKDGKFPTTVLVVNADFLKKHPQTVKALVKADVDSIAWLNDNKKDAAAVINAQLKATTGKELKAPVLARALQNVTFSANPQAQTFQELVDHGLAAGTQKKGSIQGLFDLRLLNEVASAKVSADGLGEQ
ncbi:sulfonate ABC transporter substrate-binding protein [Microbacterium mangrovi]|uniref:Sulfonate ABC transporter substrate-binding protein n=1 Tax=Microbacterium mangrovi TaxID=1348253 RepID=A0A0B2A2T3_9MICO|nr:ABC transporter substrate-binding protein [Microbacterium mangrovi]KHK95883.1 sulfonate ABC transporter substrate-binding protein [Microbacterium mangrovi]